MELSQDLVGQYVTVQLGRPLYVSDYNCTILDAKAQNTIGYVLQPQLAPNQDQSPSQEPVLMDLFVGVQIKRVTATSVTFEYITPTLSLVERTVPAALVLCVDRLTHHLPKDLPRMDRQSRRIVAP